MSRNDPKKHKGSVLKTKSKKAMRVGDPSKRPKEEQKGKPGREN